MTSIRRWSSSACACALIVSLAPVASADEPDPASVARYEDAVATGAQLFEAKAYADAREHFVRAYQLHPEPVLLFNIASTYRREGDLARAAVYYKRFLQVAPAGDPRRPLAQETVDNIQAAQQERDDPLAKALPPVPAPPDAPAPREALPPTALGSRPLAPTEQPGAREVDRVERRGDALRWTGAGFVAAGAVGLTLSFLDARRASDAEQQLAALPAGTPWNADQQALYDHGNRASERAIWFSVAGGAAAATGVVLYIIGERRNEQAARPRVTFGPCFDCGTVGAAVAGAF